MKVGLECKGSVIRIETDWGKLIKVINFNIIYSNREKLIWGCCVKVMPENKKRALY